MVDKGVFLAKVTMTEKCLKRVKEKCPTSFDAFKADEDCQDVILFNLMQAIQGCVDLAAHIVSDEGYGMAGSMQEFFELLSQQQLISAELAGKMGKAVGFRNLIAHEYARIDLDRVYFVATEGIRDLEQFLAAMIKRFA